MRRFLLATVAAVIAASPAAAQVPEDPVEAVQYRKDTMRILAGGMGTVGGFVNDGEGTFEDVQMAVANMVEVMPRYPTLFPEGTEVGVSDSRALPVIWEDPEGVQEAYLAVQTAIGALAAAALRGDEDAVAEAYGMVGPGCGACHNAYRGP